MHGLPNLKILILCLCMTTVTEVFPCFFLSCKANARVKPAKTEHGPHFSWFLCCSMYFCVVLCMVCFVSFSALYWLFCDVLCIVCVYMCIELLPPGGYPIAVKYIIPYHSTCTVHLYTPVSLTTHTDYIPRQD